MPVSKNVILQLRGGGDLKDDQEAINNDQKDNDDKHNGDTNNQSPSQGVSFSSTAGNKNTSNRSHNHHNNYHNNLSSNNSSGFDHDGPNKYIQYPSHDVNYHNSPRGRCNGGGYYSHDVNHHHSPPDRCNGRGRYAYNECGHLYNHETVFGMQ
eukprot:11607527-Ditylum_brightwellii.AAC.1